MNMQAVYQPGLHGPALPAVGAGMLAGGAPLGLLGGGAPLAAPPPAMNPSAVAPLPLAATCVDALPGISAHDGLLQPLPGSLAWQTQLGYEQLLSAQQDQYKLALQHKDAEVAHLRARLDATEARQPMDERQVAHLLHTKDEEAAAMMAAKHKELELMAGLLQLREQQIEDLRTMLESSQLEVLHLQSAAQAAFGPGASPAVAPLLPASPHELAVATAMASAMAPAVAVAPAAAPAAAASAPAPAVASAPALAAEEDAMEVIRLRREMQRMRLRLEDLEAAVVDQGKRGSPHGLPGAADANGERALAQQEQAAGAHRERAGASRPEPDEADHHRHNGHHAGPRVAEPVADGAHLAPQFSFASLQPNGHAVAPSRGVVEGDRRGDPRAHLRDQFDLREHQQQGDFRELRDPRELREPHELREGRQGGAIGGLRSAESMPSLGALPQGYMWGRRYVVSDERALSPYRQDDARVPSPYHRDDASSIGVPPTYRSAVRVDHHEADWRRDSFLDGGAVPVGAGAGALFHPGGHSAIGWDSASEGGGAEGGAGGGRQSKDLLQEMRRLRLQMSELERVAGSPARPAAATGSSMSPFRRISEERHAGARQHLGGGGARLNGSALSAFASNGAVHRPQDRRDADERPAAISPAKSTISDARSQVDYAGWQYRPHAGDPLDAAVAALVNRPGRYSGWRAMLCRLDQGLYLCGTRRVRLRVDDAREQIEASGDDGRSWADLGDLMNGAEGSQHALLERVRSAVRSR